jgi:diguanylate cyclase (GGDEF)-like protein
MIPAKRGAVWIGCASIAFGATVLAGYAFHSSVVVQLRPGSGNIIVVSAAVSFVLAGLALLGMVRTGAIPLLAINAAAFLEGVTGRNLGVDLPRLQAWLNDASLHPGRESAITSAGFLLFGVAVLAVPHIHSRRGSHAARWLTGLVVLDGLTAVAGHILRFDLLFNYQAMTRTALHSGVAMMALGVGLWLSWREERWAGARRFTAHGRRILATAALAMVMVVVASGVSGFYLLERLVVRDAITQLELRRQERVVYVGALLQQAIERGEAMARALRSHPGVAPESAKRDFSAIVVRDADGETLARYGEPLAHPKVAATLSHQRRTELLWDHGYYLRQAFAIAGRPPATAVIEQPLPLLATVGVESPTWGKSGEVGICGAGGKPGRIACFPIRMHPQPFSLNFAASGAAQPMSQALLGRTGVVEALDYRGRRVLAAFAPIRDTGLGLVAKIDAAELYQPIRRQFEVMMPLLVVLTLGGIEMLRWQIRPVVRELVDSRNRAITSEARFRAAAESGIDPFFIFESVRDPTSAKITDFRLVYANHAGEQLAEIEAIRSVRIGLAELRELAAAGGFLEKFGRVVASRRPLDQEFPLAPAAPRKPGEDAPGRWFHLQAAPLGDGVAATVRDISLRKWEEERLIAVAQTDPLTGLANRPAFRKRLIQAMETSRRLRRQSLVAVLYLDIDHFKEINDTFGHMEGDRLLEVFAERLRNCVRNVDTVGRPGGDEFTILLENLDSPEDAERVVLAIYTALQRKVRLEGVEVEIGTSIGLAFYRGEEMTADELLRRADTAMYAAKRAGRNRFRVFAA